VDSIDAAALVPWVRWVTPEISPRRFDARFFLARAPAGQEPRVDGREATEGLWISPMAALGRWLDGDMQLAPATAGVEWAAPPAPMVDPVNEGLAIMRNVRSGIQSLSDALRERGMDPTTVFEEIAADFKTLDKLGIILDCDPRNVTQAGQLQGQAADDAKPAVAPVEDSNLRHALSVVPRR